MEDDEIVIGIDRQNLNSRNSKKNKNKTNYNKHNKKQKSDLKNNSNSKKQSKTSNTKSHNKENNNRTKKSNTKSRISLALKSSKDNIETQNLKVKIVAIVLISVVFIVILLSSKIFDIKSFNVNGTTILSDETIISLSGIEKYTNIFRFNKMVVKNNIESNAYIEEVKIRRKLPSTIDINVKERIPTFMLQFADSYVYINNQGYILEISNEKLNVPILAGCTTELVNIKPGNRINDEDLKKMNTVIKICEIAKSNELGDLITKIDISNSKNYTIVLEGEGKTVYLGDCNDSDLNTKMLYLKSIVDASQGRAGEVFLNINLNSQNVYVRWSTE